MTTTKRQSEIKCIISMYYQSESDGDYKDRIASFSEKFEDVMSGFVTIKAVEKRILMSGDLTPTLVDILIQKFRHEIS